jgi:hypothetical protein
MINSPIPTIILLTGIFFLAFPIATQMGRKITIAGRRRIVFIGIGIFLVLLGISLYWFPSGGRSSTINSPTILGVTVRASQGAGGLVYLTEIDFFDEDGNTDRAEWELVDLSDASMRQYVQLQNEPVEALPEVQKIRATLIQPWRCEDRIYVATLEVSLLDADGNRSKPVRYSIDCK